MYDGYRSRKSGTSSSDQAQSQLRRTRTLCHLYSVGPPEGISADWEWEYDGVIVDLSA